MKLRDNSPKQWRLLAFASPILYAAGHLSDSELRELSRPYTSVSRIIAATIGFALLGGFAVVGIINTAIKLLHR